LVRSESPAVQFDRAKFKELILLVCRSCDPSRLGAVKLHKILYLSEMLQFAFEGHPMAGSTYIKRAFGPTSRELLPALRELEREGAIRIRIVDYFRFRKATYLPQREADLTLFTAAELMLIGDVVDFVAHHNTAKTISEFSHNRAWEMAEFGSQIPYHTAFALLPSEISNEAVEWAESVSDEVEAERSQRPAMDYESFASFRSRMQADRG
jgi:Protein of unknown function (DUF4065)